LKTTNLELANFDPELLDLCRKNGVASALQDLKNEGFTCSEEDPLLILVVDVNNPASVAYAQSGNYGLAQNHPAALNWPGGQPPAQLVHGVAALPPGALGKFIANVPGVVDKSGGNNCVFYLPNNRVLRDVCRAGRGHVQFRMYGPANMPAVNQPVVQEDECPVKFYTLSRLDGEPQPCDVYWV
jgi:hypothetical protein